ncbi:MAG: hypothetical protein A3F35_01230 [Candidatus Woykebacteria bacterium RIFCSPHIGHO2_12_FULL_45_10]|uniref:DUF5678 domain-containing protein n=1 Tax=Candidatus Woykebacteria bacterium RIFCSPHIGHO2_12_FULL_45_10 TaxID=1802603 RepID=A0A1G1WNJ2_9BACT|nr:MAG: hypothetical protein A3F35_01230 [Candidatus Woykebacteria bacterium RIFCSPHIGHO2_12_FULL_45_10]
MLEKEYNFYLKNQTELLKKYSGKFIVIVDEKVLGAYQTEKEAFDEAIKTHELGTFLIQECTPNPDKKTQVFHSRTIF